MDKISIKDIARLSGVSVATVSRVINNNGRFSEETREKVLKVISETGYQMNFSAKNLRMNKSYSIGILVPDIGNYFFSQIVQDLETSLFEKGYSTIICNTSRNVEKEASYIHMLEGKGIDGLIVISGAEKFSLDEKKHNFQIPYICIDREPKDKEKTVFISSNHYQGAFDATNYLFEKGATNPVIITHNRTSTSTKERTNGFKDALRRNSIVFHEDRHMFRLKGKNQKEAFLNFLEANRVDSIFAINDNVALQVLDIINQSNFSIPDDIQLIGFDNIPTDEYTNPRLSSVKQNTIKLANQTIDFLIKMIENETDDYLGDSKFIPVELCLRDTTR